MDDAAILGGMEPVFAAFTPDFCSCWAESAGMWEALPCWTSVRLREGVGTRDGSGLRCFPGVEAPFGSVVSDRGWGRFVDGASCATRAGLLSRFASHPRLPAD